MEIKNVNLSELPLSGRGRTMSSERKTLMDSVKSIKKDECLKISFASDSEMKSAQVFIFYLKNKHDLRLRTQRKDLNLFVVGL